MPQITIGYSDNVNIDDLKDAALGLHRILTDVLPTKIEQCKTRIIKYKDYLIGDGNERGAFVHVDIGIMAGRTENVINSAAQVVLKHLYDRLPAQSELDLQLTLEIRELPSAYFKYSK